MTLNDPEDWKDHLALKDWAAEVYPAVTLVKAGEAVCALPLYDGTARSITLRAVHGVTVRLSAEEQARVTGTVYAPHYLYPQDVENCRGKLVFTLDGIVVGECTLSSAVPAPDK